MTEKVHSKNILKERKASFYIFKSKIVFRSQPLNLKQFGQLQDTLSDVLSDAQSTDYNARFTTAPLNPIYFILSKVWKKLSIILLF